MIENVRNFRNVRNIRKRPKIFKRGTRGANFEGMRGAAASAGVPAPDDEEAVGSGSNGSDFSTAAEIRAVTNGAGYNGSNSPGELRFQTTATNAISTTERMRIASNGSILSYAVDTPSYTIRNAASAGTSIVFIQGLII